MARKKQGAKAGSGPARRTSAPHRGAREHNRRGGFAIDPELAKVAGRKGIEAARQKYGNRIFSERGRLGGQATRDRFGSSHFKELGRRGAEARKLKRSAERQAYPEK